LWQVTDSIILEANATNQPVQDAKHLLTKVQNRNKTLKKRRSGGDGFRLETLEVNILLLITTMSCSNYNYVSQEMTMYYKGSKINSSADYMALGKDDFFVLDHQRMKDSEGRLTEVCLPYQVHCLPCYAMGHCTRRLP
jgi:hypothetical protein